jgi:hypothetical protein
MAYKECVFHVYLLNEHFSPEFAEAQYGGKDSENNRRYDWEDEFAITSQVKKIEVLEYAEYPLRGQLPDGKEFSHSVHSMVLFRIESENAPDTFVGASQSIVDRYEQEEKDGSIRIRIYLKDYEPMANPIPGIYIASKEFPKELIF